MDEPEEITVVAVDGSPLAETLEPLSDPRVREEVARRLKEAGIRVTLIQVSAKGKGRHRRLGPGSCLRDLAPALSLTGAGAEGAGRIFSFYENGSAPQGTGVAWAPRTVQRPGGGLAMVPLSDEASALRLAFGKRYEINVIRPGVRPRLEAVSRDGGNPWCLISDKPLEIWRELAKTVARR